MSTAIAKLKKSGYYMIGSRLVGYTVWLKSKDGSRRIVSPAGVRPDTVAQAWAAFIATGEPPR